jgi:hypothetical protein
MKTLVVVVALSLAVLALACGDTIIVAPTPTENASAPTKSGTQSAYGYTADVLEIGAIIKGVDEKIQTMTSEATDDPSLISDEGWLADIDHEQALVLEVQQRLATMNPPAAFQKGHDLLVEGVDEHAIALELFERGCDESDVNLFNEAADHMDKAASLMGQERPCWPPRALWGLLGAFCCAVVTSSVGGIRELPPIAAIGGSPSYNYAVAAVLALVPVAALTAGAWYARRRWLG